MPRGEFPAKSSLDAEAVPVASSTSTTAICASQVVGLVVIMVLIVFLILVVVEPIRADHNGPQTLSSALTGPMVGIAAEDALEAMEMGVEAILLDGHGQGEDVGLSGFLPLLWPVPLPSPSPGRSRFARAGCVAVWISSRRKSDGAADLR